LKKILAFVMAILASMFVLVSSNGPQLAVADTQTPITSTQTLADGRAYTFHRIAETQYQSMPLVIMLHGLSQTSDTARSFTNLEAYSDTAGFNVIFGKGTAGKWNAGSCCGGATTDDVQYLKNVVDDISNKTLVDRSRVYIWGFSNGGMMAFRAICEAPDYFAAAGVDAGSLVTTCGNRVNVRQIHGADDTTVPFRGGTNSSLGVTFKDMLRITDYLPAGSTWTPTLLANCGHAWASTSQNTCGYSATGNLWTWSSQFTKP
jgi:poly(3-hydroxybutyrate) depolymerase